MASKKKPKDRLTCPCCGKSRSIDATPLLQVETELCYKNGDPWQRLAGWSVTSARSGFLQWACNRCIQSGRALRGNPAVQTYCDDEPYFAYYDVTLRCHDCGQDFVFAAAEQQFWYEQLKFWVQSRPKQCVVCRRARRQKITEQRTRLRKGDAK